MTPPPKRSNQSGGGVTRISAMFAALKKKKEKALIFFMTAGDPGLLANEKLVYALEKDGADLIELGVPFSDPLADGPVIQASSQRSLDRKINLSKILGLVRNIRKNSEIPLVLMTYLNPVLHFGLKRFFLEAKKAGVDGVIIPELPPDEGKEIAREAAAAVIDLVYLMAPTSSAGRKLKIARASRGFIYYVSVTGVTGVKTSIPASVRRDIAAVKSAARLPVCVGFGISTPAQAKEMARVSDGVIIGSALVRSLAENRSADMRRFSQKFARPFARALGKGF